MEPSYSGYDEWKGWDVGGFMRLTDRQRAYYALEFSGVALDGPVLEVGFGGGTLLAWLREQGTELFGTELSEQGRRLAVRNGVTVVDPSLDDLAPMIGRFAVIAAFDVLEHLTIDQIDALLDRAGVLLRPGGYFVARFPNGGSPFGRAIQHGDITHLTTLTISKLGQLLAGRPLEIVRAGDSATSPHGGLATRLAKRARGLLRRGFEAGLRALYGIEGPLYPNLTVVLRRSAIDALPVARG